MTSVLEPTIGNVLLLSVLLIVSGVIILSALRKFKMHIASSLFSFLFLIVGSYIPFYFLGTLTMNAIAREDNSSFSFFFLQGQLDFLNAPFVFFESISLFVGIIAIIAVVALIITAIFLVKIVIKVIGKARDFHFGDAHGKKRRFFCHVYIPDYHNTYLVTRRLRN